MTSAEIHEFLDRFSRAWEGQDVKALVGVTGAE